MSKEFGCCGDPEPCGGQDYCECIPLPLGKRVIPLGTLKEAGQPRKYTNTNNDQLTREEFMAWSRAEGQEVDPLVYWTEMGHWPPPPDIRPLIPEEVLRELERKHA